MHHSMYPAVFRQRRLTLEVIASSTPADGSCNRVIACASITLLGKHHKVALWLQDRLTVATELAAQQNVNSRAQRDVERFKNREQLLAKVCQVTQFCSAYKA